MGWIKRSIVWTGGKISALGRSIQRAAREPLEFSKEEPETLSDELGRRGFAKSLARYIAKVNTSSVYAKERKSTTIGVYGEWGSGKTYLKNLVLRELKKGEAEIPYVEYNPWQWSGQEKLTESFFDTLENKFQQLGATEQPDAKTYSEISTKLRKLFLATSVFGPSPRVIAALQTLLFGVIAYFLGTANWNEWPWIAQVAAITGTALGLAFWFFGRVAERIASWMEINSSLAERSLEKVKEDLTDLFVDLDRPFLVVIDDMDRLTAEQIRMMMQLIKANADFPNVVYLVLFERDIVTGSLSDKDNNIDGAKFLEKIVHLSFDLPESGQSTLVEEFKDRLRKELASRKIPAAISRKVGKDIEEESTRLSTVIHDFAPHFVNTLRNVNRIVPSFVFYLEHYTDRSESDTKAAGDEEAVGAAYLEINPGDLLALELLRNFEPGVYERIPDHKGVLTSPIPFITLSSNRGEDVLNDLFQSIEQPDEIEQSVGERTRREVLESLIKHLFPQITDSGRLSSVEVSEVERQVDHPDVFDRYFERRITGSMLRKAQVEQILQSTGDREALVEALNERIEAGQFGSTLNELAANVNSIDSGDLETVLTALFDVGEAVSFKPEQQGGTSTAWYAQQVADEILQGRLDDPDERTDLLEEALKATDGLLLPSCVVQSAIQDNVRRLSAGEDGPIYSEQGLEECGKLAAGKIETAAANGDLLDHEHAGRLVHQWKFFGGQGDLADWVSDRLDNNPTDAVRILRALSTSPEDPQKTFFFNGQELADLGILEPLRDALDEIGQEVSDQEELMGAFKSAWEREMGWQQAEMQSLGEGNRASSSNARKAEELEVEETNKPDGETIGETDETGGSSPENGGAKETYPSNRSHFKG